MYFACQSESIQERHLNDNSKYFLAVVMGAYIFLRIIWSYWMPRTKVACIGMRLDIALFNTGTRHRIFDDSTSWSFDHAIVRLFVEQSTTRQIDHATTQPFKHSVIRSFDQLTTRPFNNSTIRRCDHTTLLPFDNSTNWPWDNSMTLPFNSTIRFFYHSTNETSRYSRIWPFDHWLQFITSPDLFELL